MPRLCDFSDMLSKVGLLAGSIRVGLLLRGTDVSALQVAKLWRPFAEAQLAQPAANREVRVNANRLLDTGAAK